MPLVAGSSGPTMCRPLAALAVPLAAFDVPERAAAAAGGRRGPAARRRWRRWRLRRSGCGGSGWGGSGAALRAASRSTPGAPGRTAPPACPGRASCSVVSAISAFGFLQPVGLDRIVDLAQRVPELDFFLVQARRRLRRRAPCRSSRAASVFDQRPGDERRRLRLEVGPPLAVVGHDARKDRGLDLVLALFRALAELIDLGLLLPQLDQRFENRRCRWGSRQWPSLAHLFLNGLSIITNRHNSGSALAAATAPLRARGGVRNG